MSTFLFTAVNRDGKSVTERVEAENLSQARYKLELHNYSEITFYESELSSESDSLFEEKHIKAKQQNLQNQVGYQYDTSLTRYFINLFKASAIYWLLIVGSFLFVQNIITLLILGGSLMVTGYLSIPVIIFNRLNEAHGWGRNGQVRFWSFLAKFFNPVVYVKIPEFEIDSYLSCVDAREGKMEAALQRIKKYEHEPNITKRMFYLKLIRLYSNAGDFDKVLSLLEESLNAGNVYPEELLDYALCLARRHKQTSRAKGVLEKVFDRELTAMANLFIPYCQGIIEVEDGNYSQAEFYLKQASKELEPFEKNTFLIGLKSEVNAFLAMALGNQGEKDEAARLYEEAKPYLLAVRENELLERCESILR
jgi:hypothetical protein